MSDESRPMLNDAYKQMDLLPDSKYMVLHLRCGDDYIGDAAARVSTNAARTKKMMRLIGQAMNDLPPETAAVMLADNTCIKHIVKHALPRVRIHELPITHLGENFSRTDDSMAGTMVDFNILAGAQRIDSFTVYEHGSGFSQWCATIHNIPYSCTILPWANIDPI